VLAVNLITNFPPGAGCGGWPRKRSVMGKKFAVFEVESFAGGFVPISGPVDDKTWIDSRHVIDGDRLREATPLAGDRYFCPKVGWTIAPMNSPMTALILDPPKPEGDEWERWVDDCPILKNEGMDEVLKNWFRVMPRKS